MYLSIGKYEFGIVLPVGFYGWSKEITECGCIIYTGGIFFLTIKGEYCNL